MSTRSRRDGVWYVAISGVFFGLIGYFGLSVLHASWSVNALVFWRFLLAALLMFGVMLVQRTPWCWQARDLWRSFLHGLWLYGPSSILYFIAADKLGSGLSMVIFFTYPVFVMALNRYWFQMPISSKYYWALAVIFLGLACLLQSASLQSFQWQGMLISVLSAMIFAAYMALNHDNQLPASVDTCLMSLGAALSGGIAACFQHDFMIPTTLEVGMNLLGIAAVCTAIPILLLLKGLKNIGAMEASILSVLEPVVVVFFGVVLLGETVSMQQIMGSVVLLLGALLALLSS